MAQTRSSRPEDIPATQGMLTHTRKELKADIAGLRSELKADIAELRGEVKAEIAEFRGEVKAEIAELRAEMTAGFHRVDARLEQMSSEISRMAVLVEEQNARNQVVLEGFIGLYQRQDRVESRVDAVEKLVRGLSR